MTGELASKAFWQKAVSKYPRGRIKLNRAAPKLKWPCTEFDHNGWCLGLAVGNPK
jgi:hypothetical protein